MFLKCFQELLGSPKLLQMTHLTTVPLKHQATGHQGTEGGNKCAAQRFPRAGQVAARPLNELQWRVSQEPNMWLEKERQQQRESPIELEPFASSCSRPALSSVWSPH